MSESVKIIGASENNLKNINVQIPKKKITTISGVSGSGKTSLMFNIVVAESQRREKILNHTATDFEIFNRPNFKHLEYDDCVHGVSQKTLRKSEVSTVGTASKLNDLIKELLIEKGEIICQCDAIVSNICPLDVVIKIISHDSSLKILYKLKNKSQPISNKSKILFESLKISEIFDPQLKKLNVKKIFSYEDVEIYGLIERKYIDQVDDIDTRKIKLVKDKEIIYDFSYQTFCEKCLTEYQVISKSLFTKAELSDHNGRCKACNGSGMVASLDLKNLINPIVPLNDVFLNIPHTGKAYKYTYLQDSDIKKLVGKDNYHLKFSELNTETQNNLLAFLGKKILPHEGKKEISRYISKVDCHLCKGTGLVINQMLLKSMG